MRSPELNSTEVIEAKQFSELFSDLHVSVALCTAAGMVFDPGRSPLVGSLSGFFGGEGEGEGKGGASHVRGKPGPV